MNRRDALTLMGATAAATALPAPAAAKAAPQAGTRWVSTTHRTPWRAMPVPALAPLEPNLFGRGFEIKLDQPQQEFAGFGGAFGEKGWEALLSLTPTARERVIASLFGDDGAAFNLCRTPIGANDISRKWYSYDETPGDFALRDFSIANDRETLIPFIRAAMAHRRDLKLWASPWSPPTWMKTGRHYAQTPAWPGQPANGLQPGQEGAEGKDSFIQDDRYFDAYARYFRRYVEGYRAAGVPIAMVMPQNEFNSAQPFPSCCWTPEGLARFIPFLGREMGAIGVDIFFGTLERGNADLLSKVLADPKAARFIKGVGVQWAGKNALAEIHRRHPALPVWGSEQECGNGDNSWYFARYAWRLMKRYFEAGASAWHYWNMVMPTGGMSGWGWPQNALVTVDPTTRRVTYNPDYWTIRHLSAFVARGARLLPTESFLGWDNQLALANPDGSVVLVMPNEMAEPLAVRAKVGSRQLNVVLPAYSLNTFVLDIDQ